MNISKRKAEQQDLHFLLALRKATMNAHLLASSMSVSDANHLQRIQLEFESAEIVESAGRPVGLMKVTRRDRSWELIQLQLLPHLQGLGIGSKLIDALLQEAHSAGASVALSVLKSNPARHLYARHGFVVCGESAQSFEMICEAHAPTPRAN
jgi:ribosomal protein S18 acetylase RimI-like enzyme